VEKALSTPKTKKLRELAGKSWKILDHKEAKFGSRVVLENEEGKIEVVYSTKQMEKLLEESKHMSFFNKKRPPLPKHILYTNQNQQIKIYVGMEIFLKTKKEPKSFGIRFLSNKAQYRLRWQNC